MARHIGCFFHYTQSIHRKIQSLELSSIYKDDESIRCICHQLMALTLLPRDQVEQGLEYLANNHPESIHDLFVYFEDYSVDNVPINLWNVSQFKVRTNNNAEGKTIFYRVHNTRDLLIQDGTIDLLTVSTKNIAIFGISFKHYKKKKYASISMFNM